MNPQPALPTLGRWPLFFPFLGTVIGILTASHALWWLVVVLFTWGFYFGALHRKPPLVVACLLLLLSAVIHHHRLGTKAELANLLNESPETLLHGTLVRSQSAGLTRRVFKTEQGASLLLIDLPEHFKTGQKLDLMVASIQTTQPRNPASWTPEATLQKKGLVGSVRVLSAKPMGWSRGFPTLRGWSESIRDDFAKRITYGISNREDGEIVQAVVLGKKTAGSTAFSSFRKTGTMHIFAVSGLHVGLVATIVLALGHLVRIPSRGLHWLIILAMFGYAFITGLQAPALRAALMGSLILGRLLLYRRPSVVNNLLAAGLVILLLDSFQLFQTGFQLSFWVVTVILMLEPLLWRKVGPVLDHDAYLPAVLWSRWQRITHWTRNKVGKLLTISSAAWVGSAPLSAFYFGWFTPIAVVASLVMVSSAFLILVLAFFSLALGQLIPSLSPPLNMTNGFLAKTAHRASIAMSEWPGAWTQLNEPSPWRGGLCVFDIYYGGSAIHLDAGGGVLIDSGSERSFWWSVQPALQSYGHSFDSLIATHNDAEHVGGFSSIIPSYSVKQVLFPHQSEQHSLANAMKVCQAEQVSIRHPTIGTILPIDKDTQITILHVGERSLSRADDRGLTLLIEQRGWRILVTADAGYESERALLASGQNLRADVWICGRNEKDSMGQDAFVRAISPKAIILNEEIYSTNGRASAYWQEWLQQEGIALFRQSEHGAVFIETRQSQLNLRGFLSGKQMTLTRSHSEELASSSPPLPIGVGSPIWDQN